MSALALKLIAENKAKHERGEDATYLDLGNCGLEELPKEIGELVWVEMLVLSNEWEEYDLEKKEWYNQKSRNKGKKNYIVSIIGIEKLILLKKLVVAKDYLSLAQKKKKKTVSKFKDLSPLAGLYNLQTLYCSSTQVSDLSPLSRLTNLQIINCDSTPIDDLVPLENLTNLRLIYFYSTRVHDLSPLAKLKNLQIINCDSTKVSDLSPLSALTNLQKLYCSQTKVSDLSPLIALINLQTLSFHSTKVNSIFPLAKLAKLKTVYCFSTKINDLSAFLPLILNNIPVKWQDLFEHLREDINNWKDVPVILVKNCPIVSPPQGIVKQGNEAILRYWEQIDKQGGTEIINEAKLIIVGEGKTGKTTLFNKLIKPGFDLHKNPTDETHGINIHEGLVMQGDFRANLWDFGGQELQYMTHQFFLTPKALYVLMMDARAEAPNLSYWFKIISLLGKDRTDEKVSLLIVLNKRKGSTGRPQYHDLLKLYEDDFDYQFLEVDFSENDEHWEYLKVAIGKRLFNLPIVKNALPKQWKPIREALREESKERNYITTDRLHKICSEYGVTVEAEQWQMTDYLHQLGSLLHFQNDPDLMDLVILRPEWAVEGVYTTLKSDLIKEVQKGKFTAEDIFQILQEKNYSKADAQKILKLMSKNNFDICYESENKDHFVAAQLLPDNAPEYNWFPKNMLQFRYQYPIMPKGLMSRLIVRLSDNIEQNPATGQQVVWKKGVVLHVHTTEGECRVRLREDDAESKSGLRQITIEVMGSPDARKYALRRVRDAVEELHKRWFRNIKADEMVPCCCSECAISEEPQLYKLADLIKLKVKRSTTVCYISGDDVPIQLLLEGVYDTAEIKAMEHQKSQ